MIAEVIALGDELTSGQRLDTNSQWLSQRLGELGVGVAYHSTVGDQWEAGVNVFRTAIDRSDLVITTGGLGPTADDLTRDLLARVADVELVRDDAVLAHVRELFARRGRDMPARNEVQAMFPAGSRPIPNPHGTAPGIDVEIPRPGRLPCRLFALPGVPAEVFEMWAATVAPEVAALCGEARVIRHRRIKCFGVGESHLEQMLPDLIQRGREPSVGITVHEGTITLRVTAHGSTTAESLAAMEPTLAEIRRSLGELVFGEEDDELEHAVVRELQRRGQTLATAEWGTAGLVAGWLSHVADGEDTYLGGAVLRNSAACRAYLKMEDEMAEDSTSAEVASRLAYVVQREFATDYGLAVSNVPSAADGTPEQSRYHVAIAAGDDVRTLQLPYAAHPAIARPLAAKRALNVLRLHLMRELSQ